MFATWLKQLLPHRSACVPRPNPAFDSECHQRALSSGPDTSWRAHNICLIPIPDNLTHSTPGCVLKVVCNLQRVLRVALQGAGAMFSAPCSSRNEFERRKCRAGVRASPAPAPSGMKARFPKCRRIANAVIAWGQGRQSQRLKRGGSLPSQSARHRR